VSINFYRAAAMQQRYFDSKHLSVRPSIYTRLSNTCIETKR